MKLWFGDLETKMILPSTKGEIALVFWHLVGALSGHW